MAVFIKHYYFSHSLTIELDAISKVAVLKMQQYYLPIYLWLYSRFVGSWPLFQFLDLFAQSVGLLGRRISPSQGRYLHTE
jgi:hypothetical protein